MGIIVQFIQINITWKQCARLPTELNHGKTTVINGKVYCGGGIAALSTAYAVYCYDPSQNEWTTLPRLPVCTFGLGQLRGKLVAVGGEKTNDVYTYDERSQTWEQTVPPMPTARDCMHVLSLQSGLVVAGGCTTVPPYYTATVEIFKPDTSQWYRTDPLPIACCQVSLVAIGNICYALGGYDGSCLSQALYASVGDLLANAIPANQTTYSGSSDTQSAWKTLPNTPTYQPTVAVLDGNLLAIGGKETGRVNSMNSKKVYMYSPSTNSWIHISDLPAPISGTGVAVLSSTGQILMIGGHDGDYKNTVYKGTLQLKLQQPQNSPS